jgi:hypothetical protein
VRALRSFAFGVKELHQILDLVGLENIAEGGHGSAAIVNLMLDLLLVQALANGAQVRPEFPTAAIYAMAMFTSLFMKEGGSGVLTLAGVSVNDRSGKSWQAACQSYDNCRDTEGGIDSRGGFSDFLQRNKSFCD